MVLIRQVSKKYRFYALALSIYLLTVACLGQLLYLPTLNRVGSAQFAKSLQRPYIPFRPRVIEIDGMPIRIVLPQSNVDLMVIPGYYNASSDSWTLSGYHAQFDMMSTLPNNVAGQTFIYGHNNDYVFGALRHVTPSPGAPALLYLSNGHILQYSFMSVQSVGPSNVSVIKYTGSPTLLIQTCTGSLNEWRTEYSYKFVKAVQ